MRSYVYVCHLTSSRNCCSTTAFSTLSQTPLSPPKVLSFKHFGSSSDFAKEDHSEMNPRQWVVLSSSRDEHNLTLNMVLAMDTGEGSSRLPTRAGLKLERLCAANILASKRLHGNISNKTGVRAMSFRHGLRLCPSHTGFATFRASPFPVTTSRISFQLDGTIAYPASLLATTTPKSSPAVLM